MVLNNYFGERITEDKKEIILICILVYFQLRLLYINHKFQCERLEGCGYFLACYSISRSY
jgi:hypothetical protein